MDISKFRFGACGRTAVGGGGRAGGRGSAFKMLESDGAGNSALSSSNPSWALGTISDKTSKSSEDKANDV